MTSGADSFHDVTGGVYKTRERIQGVIADTPLLAIPTSWSRVADSNPNWGRFWGFAPPRGIASHCTGHCSTCAALGIRAIRTWRHPRLPPAWHGQSRYSAQPNCWQITTRVALVAGLNRTSHDTSWRQPCSTCNSAPKRSSISRAVRNMSNPGKVLRVASN